MKFLNKLNSKYLKLALLVFACLSFIMFIVKHDFILLLNSILFIVIYFDDYFE